jgi:hypothetical protein
MLIVVDYTLDTSYGYPEAPSNAATASTRLCKEWWSVTTSDTCASILATKLIRLYEFYAWNPSVGEDCTGLWQETAYCVSGPDVEVPSATGTPTTSPTSTPTGVVPPGPTQEGIHEDCDGYVLQQTGNSPAVTVCRKC